MKRLVCTAISILSIATLTSCKGKNKQEEYVFKPSLDTETTCEIKIIGDYSNFEALEAEFDKFNTYYPNVALTYEKNDAYKKLNTLSNVLDGEDKPNIFFSYAAWMAGNSTYDPIIERMDDLSDSNINLNLDCLRPGLINHDANDKVRMVPVFSRTYGTLVNNDLFKRENIAVPTTWSELLSACQQLKAKNYTSPMMGYTLKEGGSLMNTIAYPAFVAALAGNPDMIAKANNKDPEAGEYMRDALTKVKQLVDNAIDLNQCKDIGKDYEKSDKDYTPIILRFFEGDVPFMICPADTTSGTKKRESQSEAFTANPFEYSYIPIPLTEQGGYFIDSPSIEFSINKNCNDLEMTREFMRFLITKDELNSMASIKRLVTPTKEMSFDPVYATFGSIPTERTFSPEGLGVKDPLVNQLKAAAYKVGKGEMTIDEAIANYGKF